MGATWPGVSRGSLRKEAVLGFEPCISPPTPGGQTRLVRTAPPPPRGGLGLEGPRLRLPVPLSTCSPHCTLTAPRTDRRPGPVGARLVPCPHAGLEFPVKIKNPEREVADGGERESPEMGGSWLSSAPLPTACYEQ